MALITWPECSKQISDTTDSCPHCGYKLALNKIDVNLEFKKTEITSLPPKHAVGILEIILGCILLVCCLPVILYFSILWGSLTLFFSIGFFYFGKNNLTGSNQEASCPYCEKVITFDKSTTRVKCRYCKQVSVQKDNFLTPVK